jgi:hypothetical protein
MKPRIRRLAMIVGATALVGAAGCGAAGQADSPSQQTDPPAANARPDLSALAAKLGVSTSRLETAMQATRPSPSSANAQDRAAALAKELGISEAKVRAALQSLGPPSRRPQGSGSAPAAPPSGASAS